MKFPSSFKTSKGVGYSAHFVGNCLVLTSMKVSIVKMIMIIILIQIVMIVTVIIVTP